ncbi:MAG: 4-hydroxythreonine-4-phosphate dehydrogenase PdxA [Pseudomonadota bacterium]
MTSNTKKPRLLLTSGEPAGIGPDLIVQLSKINHNYDLTIVADPDLLFERAKLLKSDIDISIVNGSNNSENSIKNTVVKVLPVKLKSPTVAGNLNLKNATYVLETLNVACDNCLANKYDAMVTAPIQKSVINDEGITFSGHTEYLAKRCNDAYPVMLLTCPELRVALVTTHLALSEVPAAITTSSVKNTIQSVSDDMKKHFGIKQPAITVCGLNPHAGEEGHLGKEEVNIINPVINKFKELGYNVSGSVPADTAFRLEQRKNADVFICMYHDQGLPVLKTLGFGEAVNVTLGLPIIRTSVDHGTALELAGTGEAKCDSLLAAIQMADKMARNRLKI